MAEAIQIQVKANSIGFQQQRMLGFLNKNDALDIDTFEEQIAILDAQIALLNKTSLDTSTNKDKNLQLLKLMTLGKKPQMQN